jgi:hypothetical protein
MTESTDYSNPLASMSAVEIVRAKPSLYFPNGQPTDGALISRVCSDIQWQAHVSGQPEAEFTISTTPDAIVVRSSFDWFEQRRDLEAHFASLIERPGVRLPMVLRTECLIAAVSKAYAAASATETFQGGERTIKLPPVQVGQPSIAWARVTPEQLGGLDISPPKGWRPPRRR